MSLNHNSCHPDLKQAAVVPPPLVLQQTAAALLAAPPHSVNEVYARVNIPQPPVTADYASGAAAQGVVRHHPAQGERFASATAAALASSSLSYDSHFAASFMAAMTYHSNQIRGMLESVFLAGLLGAANPAVPPTDANLGHALGLLQAVGVPLLVGAWGAYHHMPSALPSHQHSLLLLLPPAAGGSPPPRCPFRVW